MSIKYQMWLTHNAEQDKIQLPVLPQSFQTKNGSSNSSVSIAGLGEIIIMQSRPALRFGFSRFAGGRHHTASGAGEENQ